ncbi:MAG: FAD-binding oxidoreductase [Chloroflexi bacterium]|nr:MAG: FAD-binding oxidoreductase [Chloroflexota bacterium]
MKTIPYWLDDFPRPADLPTAPLPERIDVVVVGGGYTGLGAGRTLARNGHSVAVLEQGNIGNGASAMNGGQAGPGVKLAIQEVFKKYGPELGRQVWQATLDSMTLLEETLAEENIDCDYTPNGVIMAACKPSHYQAYAAKTEWMQQNLQYDRFKLVPPEQMHTELGTNIYHGALVDYGTSGLHPAKYLFGLARAAARAGAHICENTRVEKITRHGDGFTLATSRGPVQANAVLLATNGYTTNLVPQIQRGVFTVGSYMIVTEPLPEALQKELVPNNRVIYDSKWFLNYFRLMPDGRMSMGGRNNLSPNLDVGESAQILSARMIEIFPQLKGVPVTHTWTGQLGVTFDLMPHIGREEGVYFAYGYGGHGVALSAYLGKEAAELMTGKISRSPFAEVSHQKPFYYRGNAWFLPLAAAYYRFLDSVS